MKYPINDIQITKMHDGTFKAWRKRKVTRMVTEEIIEDAEGKTEKQALENFETNYEI